MGDIETELETYNPEQLAVLKYRMETNFLYFTAFYLFLRENQPFKLGRHHSVVADTLMRVHSGEIKRLIINIPPSYTKTELAVVQFCTYSYCLNPACRFMHISRGDTLALDNSSKIKEQVLHPITRKLWDIGARNDAKAKGLWKTDVGGMFYAVSGGGQIMGFRAGRSKPGFQGAIIIDDPQADEDVISPVKILYFPEKYKTKIKTRVDNRETPIIVIMQRLHEDDFCGWLLNGGSGEMWHYLNLPAMIQ